MKKNKENQLDDPRLLRAAVKGLRQPKSMQLNFDGHYMDDPLGILHAKPDFSDIGLQLQFKPMDFIKQNPRLTGMYDKHHEAVFADFDRMITHYARVHNLHQDEISLLLMAWFNKQPGCIKANIQWIQQQLTENQRAQLTVAIQDAIAQTLYQGISFSNTNELAKIIQEYIVEPVIEPLITGRL